MHEYYYEQVYNELCISDPLPGLWAKSFAEAKGDRPKAKALYLKYRAIQIAQEEEIKAKKKKIHEEAQELKKWQLEEEKRKSLARSEGITVIHIILFGLSLMILILLMIRTFD